MLKKILAILAMLCAAVAFAAVDVNKATEADLDAIKGIGPVMSKRIVDERKKGDFKSWDDLMVRVKGIGDTTAAKYSSQGLTVKGTPYKSVAVGGKDEKKDAKADKKEDKKEAQADKKDEKKETKAEKKEEKAVAKADKKEEKKDDKAAAAKPAASAASAAKK